MQICRRLGIVNNVLSKKNKYNIKKLSIKDENQEKMSIFAI